MRFFRREIPGGVNGLTLAPAGSERKLVNIPAGSSTLLTQIIVKFIVERERLWFVHVVVVGWYQWHSCFVNRLRQDVAVLIVVVGGEQFLELR